MRSLAKYLKRYRKESILAPLFKLLEAMFDLREIRVISQLTENYIADNLSVDDQRNGDIGKPRVADMPLCLPAFRASFNKLRIRALAR